MLVTADPLKNLFLFSQFIMQIDCWFLIGALIGDRVYQELQQDKQPSSQT
jgi:hypothetical protein